MILRDYLHFQRITIKKFSESIEITVQHVSNYIHGRSRLSKKVARTIERETNGKVTAKEVLKGNPEKISIQKIDL